MTKKFQIPESTLRSWLKNSNENDASVKNVETDVVPDENNVDTQNEHDRENESGHESESESAGNGMDQSSHGGTVPTNEESASIDESDRARREQLYKAICEWMTDVVRLTVQQMEQSEERRVTGEMVENAMKQFNEKIH